MSHRPDVRRWEYKLVSMGNPLEPNVELRANVLGGQGWDLAAIDAGVWVFRRDFGGRPVRWRQSSRKRCRWSRVRSAVECVIAVAEPVVSALRARWRRRWRRESVRARRRWRGAHWAPVGRGGTTDRNAQIARSSTSLICAKYGHGIDVSMALPSGRRPVRIARTKSASLQLPSPVGVRFAAGRTAGRRARHNATGEVVPVAARAASDRDQVLAIRWGQVDRDGGWSRCGAIDTFGGQQVETSGRTEGDRRVQLVGRQIAVVGGSDLKCNQRAEVVVADGCSHPTGMSHSCDLTDLDSITNCAHEVGIRVGRADAAARQVWRDHARRSIVLDHRAARGSVRGTGCTSRIRSASADRV